MFEEEGLPNRRMSIDGYCFSTLRYCGVVFPLHALVAHIEIDTRFSLIIWTGIDGQKDGTSRKIANATPQLIEERLETQATHIVLIAHAAQLCPTLASIGGFEDR